MRFWGGGEEISISQLCWLNLNRVFPWFGSIGGQHPWSIWWIPLYWVDDVGGLQMECHWFWFLHWIPCHHRGTLLELEVVVNHHIHQVWHILPSPSPQLFMDAGNGPPRLNPLDTMVIQWRIPKDKYAY